MLLKSFSEIKSFKCLYYDLKILKVHILYNQQTHKQNKKHTPVKNESKPLTVIDLKKVKWLA